MASAWPVQGYGNLADSSASQHPDHTGRHSSVHSESGYSETYSRADSRTGRDVLYHLHDKFLAPNEDIAWGYDLQGRRVPHIELAKIEQLKHGTHRGGGLSSWFADDEDEDIIDARRLLGHSQDPTAECETSCIDLFFTEQNWKWDWSNFTALRKWLIIYELLELVDAVGDITFISRVALPLLLARRSLDDYNVGIMVLIMAIPIYLVAQCAYLMRGALFKNAAKNLPGDWKLNVPVLSICRLMRTSDLGVLNMARIYYSYSFLVRWFEDIPQLFLAVVYMVHYGKDFSSVFVSFSSCGFLIWTTMRLLLNFPYAEWFGQIFTRVTLSEMQGGHAAGARKVLPAFCACSMWLYASASVMATQFVKTEMETIWMKSITYLTAILGLVFLIVYIISSSSKPKDVSSPSGPIRPELHGETSPGAAHLYAGGAVPAVPAKVPITGAQIPAVPGRRAAEDIAREAEEARLRGDQALEHLQRVQGFSAGGYRE